MGFGTVYGLLCPVEKRIVYVGQTGKSLFQRLLGHKASILKTSSSSKRVQWLRGLKERGLIDKILIVCLKDNVPFDRLTDCENFWINQLSAEGFLVNADRKNNYPRPLDNEGNVSCLRIAIGYKLRNELAKWLTYFTLKQLEKFSGVSEANISIAANDGLATSVVIKLLENMVANPMPKRERKKNKKNKQPIQKRIFVRKPRSFTNKVELKKRPDSKEWIFKPEQAA